MRLHALKALFFAVVVLGCTLTCGGDEVRSKVHEQYAQKLWNFLNSNGPIYRGWAKGDVASQLDFGPPSSSSSTTYLNAIATRSRESLDYGSVIVTEHLEGEKPVAVSVWYRQSKGYNPKLSDWYWIHFLADGTVIKSCVDKDPFAKRGFVTRLDDGRLWVFRIDSPELEVAAKGGELAKHVTVPRASGITLKGPDKETIYAYLTAKPGFTTYLTDGRLWVFKNGSEELKKFQAGDELAKHVTRPGGGPMGMTIKAPDSQTITIYMAAKTGFALRVSEGRLWVFREGSKELTEFDNGNELAKHVIRPGAGPGGITLKSPDASIVLEYLTGADGYKVIPSEGRLWVFREGSPELAQFEKSGEPAKFVILPGAGPMGMTVKSPDRQTIDAYLANFKK